MDKNTLSSCRDRLLAAQADLRTQEAADDDTAKTVSLDPSRIGRLTRMDALQVQAMALEVRRRRRLELRKISAALLRLENGEYGDCVRCGEPIAPGRLERDPAAPFCIDCAEASERRG